MMQLLPTEILGCVDPEKLDLDNCTHDNSRPFFIEFELNFPDALHELHNNCSLAPDRKNYKRNFI